MVQSASCYNAQERRYIGFLCCIPKESYCSCDRETCAGSYVQLKIMSKFVSFLVIGVLQPGFNWFVEPTVPTPSVAKKCGDRSPICDASV